MSGQYGSNTSAPPTTRTTPDSGFVNTESDHRQKPLPHGFPPYLQHPPYLGGPQMPNQLRGAPPYNIEAPQINGPIKTHPTLQHMGSFDETPGGSMHPYYPQNVGYAGQPIYETTYPMQMAPQYAMQPHWNRGPPPQSMQSYADYDSGTASVQHPGVQQMRGVPTLAQNPRPLGQGPHQIGVAGSYGMVPQVSMQNVPPNIASQQHSTHMQPGQMFFNNHPHVQTVMPTHPMPMLPMAMAAGPPPTAPSPGHQPVYAPHQMIMYQTMPPNPRMLVPTGPEFSHQEGLGQHPLPMGNVRPNTGSRVYQNQNGFSHEGDYGHDARNTGAMMPQVGNGIGTANGGPPPLMARGVHPPYDNPQMRFSANTPAFVPTSNYTQSSISGSNRYSKTDANGRAPTVQVPRRKEDDIEVQNSAEATPQRSQTHSPSSGTECTGLDKSAQGKPSLREQVQARIAGEDEKTKNSALNTSTEQLEDEASSTLDSEAPVFQVAEMTITEKFTNMEQRTADALPADPMLRQKITIKKHITSCDVRATQQRIESSAREKPIHKEETSQERMKRFSDNYCSYCMSEGVKEAQGHRIRSVDGRLCKDFQSNYKCDRCGGFGHIEPTCKNTPGKLKTQDVNREVPSSRGSHGSTRGNRVFNANRGGPSNFNQPFSPRGGDHRGASHYRGGPRSNAYGRNNDYHRGGSRDNNWVPRGRPTNQNQNQNDGSSRWQSKEAKHQDLKCE